MFPKKRHRKEKHLSLTKIPRTDNNPRVNSNSPIPRYNISHHPSSGPSSPPFMPLQDDWSYNLQDIMDTQPSPDPSSPPFIPSQDDWSNLQEIMDKDYPAEHTPSTSTSQYPPTISEDDWQDIESIINNSASTSSPEPPSPKLYTDYTSVFSFSDITLEQPLTSAIEQPSTSSNNNTALQSNPTSNSPIHIISSDEDTDDEDTNDKEENLTSDDIFNLMCYLSYCKNNEIMIDISKFQEINIPTNPYMHLVNMFNISVNNMSLDCSINNHRIYAGHVNSLKGSTNLMCTTLQENYPNLYPAKQILDLIRSSPHSLTCLPILDNQKPLKDELVKVKWRVNSQNRHPAQNRVTVERRREEMRKLVSAIADKFKEIYDLE
ncbi:MAG: hypothetical protein KFW09_04795 [Oscillospiraceae bacterium]|nr:hypothetical protein [Oscillospiraceae bacterium]